MASLAMVGTMPAGASPAPPVVIVASPTGQGTTCDASSPCSLHQAQLAARAADVAMTSDVDVELLGGTYHLSSPLQLGPADSGSNGSTSSTRRRPAPIRS